MIKTIYMPMKGVNAQDDFDQKVNMYTAIGFRVVKRELINGYNCGDKYIIPSFYAELEIDKEMPDRDVMLAWADKIKTIVADTEDCAHCPLYSMCLGDGKFVDLGSCPAEWKFPWEDVDA